MKTYTLKMFLSSLQNLPFLESYRELGFNLKSLCKQTQTYLLAEISLPNYTEHTHWNIYNILSFIRSLISIDEFELLDLKN